MIMLSCRLERASEAMEDAEKALVIAPYSTKARMAKAEALYSMGKFEKALVEFEKGWRIRQDPEIKTGIVKCRDVILNTVGVGALSYDGVITTLTLLSSMMIAPKWSDEGKRLEEELTRLTNKQAQRLITFWSQVEGD